MNAAADVRDLSIVIPSYNSAKWLPSTLENLIEALEKADVSVELIIVDDGSTDNTVETIRAIEPSFPAPITLVSQPNAGVFAARRRGAEMATTNALLFLDSRVLVDSGALLHIQSDLLIETLAGATRIGHVGTDESAPLVGRFWEVPTHVFWGKYLRQPTLTVLTPENFDSVPKGTGFLLASKQSFLEACDHVGDEVDRFVSDDTKLLRFMVERYAMLLDPGFRATYRPRTNVRHFLAHGYLRGTLFVDSYYGTSAVRSLVLWALALSIPIAVVTLVVGIASGAGMILTVLLAAFASLVIALVLVSVINRAPRRAVAGFLLYVVPFAGVFWAGLLRGLWLRLKAGQ